MYSYCNLLLEYVSDKCMVQVLPPGGQVSDQPGKTLVLPPGGQVSDQPGKTLVVPPGR